MDNFTIKTQTKKLYPKAMQTLVKYHNLSFADSVSVEIMKLMNIHEIAPLMINLTIRKEY